MAAQVDAFREGFNQIFPLDSLQYFYEDEIEAILCGRGPGGAVKLCRRTSVACKAVEVGVLQWLPWLAGEAGGLKPIMQPLALFLLLASWRQLAIVGVGSS